MPSSLSANDALKNKLLAALPFKPTGAQARVVAEIERDMALDVPMMRLVQGDVGSGKTLVAALAALPCGCPRQTGGPDGTNRITRRAARQ